jgi:hypothetical protein
MLRVTGKYREAAGPDTTTDEKRDGRGWSHGKRNANAEIGGSRNSS